MTDPDKPTADTDPHVNFNAPASFRKWPSLNNRRRLAPNPYLIFDGTLDECIREFMARPAAGRWGCVAISVRYAALLNIWPALPLHEDRSGGVTDYRNRDRPEDDRQIRPAVKLDHRRHSV